MELRFKMDAKKMMGLVTPGDDKVNISVRQWDGMKRQLWRSKHSWEIAQREAASLVERCAHMEGCAGKTDETAPCLVDCPDRELRMSALVILNAARQFAPLNAVRLAEGPYYAPSREHFSEVIAEFAACQVELEALRIKMGSTDSELVITLAPQLKEAPQ
jgi:hypothetical protein